MFFIMFGAAALEILLIFLIMFTPPPQGAGGPSLPPRARKKLDRIRVLYTTPYTDRPKLFKINEKILGPMC